MKDFPEVPDKKYTRSLNLAIIANNAPTIREAVEMVMEKRVELNNLFPTETYGNGCGGTCGRYGCLGSCITEAWYRYFSGNYQWLSD